jgi:putative addiction module component (TIGR02574 family)
MSYDEILEQAMALPENERGALAESLIESLEPEDADDIDPELMAEWERRIDEVDSGLVKPIPVEESLARVRAALSNVRRDSSRG